MITEVAMSKLTTVAMAFSISSAGTAIAALTEPVQIVMISSLGTLILGVVTVVFGYLSNKNSKLSKAASEEAKLVAVEAKAAAVESQTLAAETHKAVDGRVSSFLEMAKDKFTGEGKVQGQAEEKAAQVLIAQAKEVGHAEGVAEETKRALQ